MTLTTRKNQLWTLIILSALTMAIPYAIQGVLSAGKSPSQIPAGIWTADHIAWAIRAIVEGLVIGFIARTKAPNWWQGALLWFIKLTLIALIAATLGPTLYAALRGVSMREALPEWAQWAWAFGLASYMPLMVLGASYAYKVQPDDVPVVVNPVSVTKPVRVSDKPEVTNRPVTAQPMTVVTPEPEPVVRVESATGDKMTAEERRDRALVMLRDGQELSDIAKSLKVSERTAARYKSQLNGKVTG